MLIRGHRRQRTQAEADVLAACGVPKITAAPEPTAVINTLVETIASPPSPPRSQAVERRRRQLAGKDKQHHQQLKAFSFPRAAPPAPVAAKPADSVRQGMVACVQRGTRRRSFLNAVWPDYQRLFLEQLWKKHCSGGPADAHAATVLKRPWEVLGAPSVTA